MALLSRERVGNEHLQEDWEWIGCGGFGDVYKTRHKGFGLDVAIKLVNHGAGSIMPQETSLYEEASLMEQASFEFVVRVYGIYKGCPPDLDLPMQEGIVMEFMKRGSIQSLQRALSGPPPWALAFRLVHQVALGMNFLHSKNLVHHDLKPSNVLLNDDFNAKLTDFGLSRVSTSVPASNQETVEEKFTGGTFQYMPPEAFGPYKLVRSFDVYSYGILLWSVFTGKEPFPGANISLVRCAVCRNQRPSPEELYKKQVEGLKELLDLMQRCWDGESSGRPPFSDIIEITERVFKRHERRVHDDVCKVMNILDPQTSSQQSQPSGAASFRSATPGQSMPVDAVDHPGLATPTSVSVHAKVLTEEEKANFVDTKMALIVQGTTAVKAIADVLKSKGMVHSEAYSIILRKESDQDKVREIYEKPLRSGGDEVKAAFYDALQIHEWQLMKRLDG